MSNSTHKSGRLVRTLTEVERRLVEAEAERRQRAGSSVTDLGGFIRYEFPPGHRPPHPVFTVGFLRSARDQHLTLVRTDITASSPVDARVKAPSIILLRTDAENGRGELLAVFEPAAAGQIVALLQTPPRTLHTSARNVSPSGPHAVLPTAAFARFMTPARLSEDHSIVASHDLLNGGRILLLAFSDDEFALAFSDTDEVFFLGPSARHALAAVFSDFASSHNAVREPVASETLGAAETSAEGVR